MPLPFLRKKDLIVTIHGFGRKTEHEMDPVSVFLKHNGYLVDQFSYYNPEDPEDVNPEVWMNRVGEHIRKACASGRRVFLLGFSMGGVIASHYASIFPVTGLILCAPAFYPLDFSKVEQAARSRILSSGAEGSSMSSSQTRAFLEIVSMYRSSITQVDCPILILHGTDDEVIQPRSSKKVFPLIPNPQKHMVFLQGAKHRFLYDQTHESLAFALILDFLQGEIIPFAS